MAGYMYNLGVNFQGKNNVSAVLKKIDADTKSVAASTFIYGKRIKALGASLPRFRMGLMAYIGPTAALYSSARAIRAVVEEATRFEVANVQFEKLIGNTELARKKLLELRTFAAQTPFQFKNTQEVSKQLLAAGVSAENLIPTLRMLGDLGMGVPENVSQLSHAYTKIFVLGKAQWRELRMFSTAGVPLIKELQKQLGLTQSGLESFVRRGKLSLPLVQQAMRSLTGEGGKFNGMMYEMMGTSTGLWSNFRDNLDVVSQKLGASLLPVMKQVTLAATVVAQRMSEWVDKNSELIAQGVAAWADRVSRALLNLDIPKTIKHFQTLVKTAVLFAKILIGYSILVPIINTIGTAMMTVGAKAIMTSVGLKAGLAMVAKAGLAAIGIWGLVAVAVVGVAMLIYKLVSGATAKYALPQIQGNDPVDTRSLFQMSNPGVAIPSSLSNEGGQGAALQDYMGLLNSASVQDRSSMQTVATNSNVTLVLPQGVEAEYEGAPPMGVTFKNSDLGYQLGGAYA